MKKLFISCPMKGRTEENIKITRDKMHRLAEIVFNQELEVIDNYIPGRMVDSIQYIGESITRMSQADYFVGVFSEVFKNCDIERRVAMAYDIPSYFADVEVFAPDAWKMEKEHFMAV